MPAFHAGDRGSNPRVGTPFNTCKRVNINNVNNLKAPHHHPHRHTQVDRNGVKDDDDKDEDDDKNDDDDVKAMKTTTTKTTKTTKTTTTEKLYT
jgi:hypothetical protein